MMELKMARERAERTIRERAPSARSGGRASVMERNRGWRGGGHFPTRDRFIATQGESSWRNRRCFAEDPPSKRTSETVEPTVIELEDPVVQIKQEIPEAVLHEPDGTSWKRIVGPACDGMVSHTVTADPLASSSAEQPGSRQTVVEAMKTDLDQPLTERGAHEERQIEASTSFSLTGFKESELTINSTMFPSSCIEEHDVLPPMEHSSFSCVVKMESEEANSGPSTSADQWSGTVGVEWNACLASERTDDRGSTSDTLESSEFSSTVSHVTMKHRGTRDVNSLGVYSVERATNFTSDVVFPSPDLHQNERQFLSRNFMTAEDRNTADSTWSPITTSVQRPGQKRSDKKRERKKRLTCPVCGLLTRCPADLVIHQRVHTGERPYCCSVCPARFTQKGYLNVHLRGHTGEKPFSCPCCEKCFSKASSLKTHMRMHTGEKPFCCAYCDKSFASSKYLNKHQRRVHTGVMFSGETSH